MFSTDLVGCGCDSGQQSKETNLRRGPTSFQQVMVGGADIVGAIQEAPSFIVAVYKKTIGNAATSMTD